MRPQRVALLTTVLALALAGSAQARTVDLTVQNQSSHIPTALLAPAERAVTDQVHQLQRYWRVPNIAFVPSGGIPVDLFGGAHNFFGGVHFYTDGQPSIWISTGTAKTTWSVATSGGGGMVPWTVGLSHEVMEMLVNPRVRRKAPHRIDGHRVWVEVADPVEHTTYRLDGVRVSDFVTPRWFRFTKHGRFDFLGRIHHPYTLAPGGYVPGQA